jgi:hypothetical protein
MAVACATSRRISPLTGQELFLNLEDRLCYRRVSGDRHTAHGHPLHIRATSRAHKYVVFGHASLGLGPVGCALTSVYFSSGTALTSLALPKPFETGAALATGTGSGVGSGVLMERAADDRCKNTRPLVRNDSMQPNVARTSTTVNMACISAILL